MAADVGGRIRGFRLARHMTQDDLAEKVGVTRNAVSYWELNRRALSIGTLEKVATALGIDPSELLEEQVPLVDAPSPGPETAETVEEILALSEEEFEVWLGNASYKKGREQLRGLAALLGEYQASAPTFSSREAALAYGKTEESRRGDRLHRRVYKLMKQFGKPPVAKIIWAEGRQGKPPRVLWLIPEEERGPWREQLDENYGEYEQYEPHEAAKAYGAEYIAETELAPA